MTQRDVLICTVGTSLLSNITGKYRDDLGITPERHQTLQELAQSGDWASLVKRMLEIDPMVKVCGAEINSIQDAAGRKWLDPKHLRFLVSDTEDGRRIGDLLVDYFIGRDDLTLSSVDKVVVTGLQDDRPKDFKIHGLRNLVREAGEIINRYGEGRIAINATGGYKAQIAVAVVLGQVLGIPVLYRHERFSEIIDFPPMPIAFDYTVLGENSPLLTDFERNAAFALSEIQEFDERIRVLLTEVPVDDLNSEPMFELGAIGQIFLLGYRLRFLKPTELTPASDKQPPRFREDHYPIGFKDFVTMICEKTSWVKSAHSLPYDKQKSIKGIGFYLREGKLIGTYQDKNGFGGRFELLTTATTTDGLTWAADQLNQKYRE